METNVSLFSKMINVLMQDAQFIAARLVMVIKFPLQLQGGVTHLSSVAVS